MKLEKEVFINDYEFNYDDDGFDYVALSGLFKSDERVFIIKNFNKKVKLTLEIIGDLENDL